MFWLFTQMFVLCGVAFAAGAALTWLPLRATIRGLRAELADPVPRPAIPATAVVLAERVAPREIERRAPEPPAAKSTAPEPPATEPTAAEPPAPEPTATEPAAGMSGSEAPGAAQEGVERPDAARSNPTRSAAGRASAPRPAARTVRAGRPDATPTRSARPEPQVKGSPKSMIFHTPDSPYFKRMKGDVTFRSAAEAERAGYTRWRPRSAAPAS
ncbi:sunset domain-containing protein [Saccharothrix algeriensis]|uniref:Secreted protein n=1 Tax=Saccharothrix algeriensis TaxID=173560 RepID=A0ABS2S4R5_9PSEU|nr:hypothetical protein [Saccharothrix algeriensis]MBM7810101.1 hypothetical protein [Saccharothrix algeriensis]